MATRGSLMVVDHGRGAARSVSTHISHYPAKFGSSHAPEVDTILDNTLGTDTGGMHVTLEVYGQDDGNSAAPRKNPHVYRNGQNRNLTMNATSPPNSRLDYTLASLNPNLGTQMSGVLNNVMPGLGTIAKEWRDNKGLTPDERDENTSYLAELKEELAKLG